MTSVMFKITFCFYFQSAYSSENREEIFKYIIKNGKSLKIFKLRLHEEDYYLKGFRILSSIAGWKVTFPDRNLHIRSGNKRLKFLLIE